MKLNPSLAPWRGKRVWIVGASTGIGRAVAEALMARGAHVTVSARNERELRSFAAPGCVLALDATSPGALQDAAASLLAQGPLDLAVYCAGYWQPMRADSFDLAQALKHQEVNYSGALRLLGAVLPALHRQGHGHVSLVGSVAGYRGLPLSLAYGPTKAALINLAESLYLDLRAEGIGVSIVNPGFVETPMTAVNDFHMPAMTQPADAAAAILRGWERGQFEIHFPKRFTLGVKLLSMLPFDLYQSLVRRGTAR
ncbi:SDR family NAD(P)-dependent oxidoreductase [Ramlibacter albus]|uniref:SDR family NAD(P)-dependent oxidoreductase n=1 Tax=Ramlibacter albus TaxID=2079448 RepID=A0A923M6P7_9BURK|nr:SDR family NAD(P)-dependent oxidoreductase [Ramlibacter albus]MBC5765237.1 SDR family NAD(P)-dependent oxidoreductase [Ramlibacter albus]